ncbi:MAG: NAD(P)/FAD-dependent oxidoreductase [Brumimicrobium sp.]|nr:NAD(P)/FAD-dependent oxidoreductase [Brumimicrobium sp.]
MVIDIPKEKKKRIVMIGCGFAGLEFAKTLKNKNVQVVIVDKNNYHLFQPLLYQVATSVLEAESIAYPIRKIFGKSSNIYFRKGEVREIVLDEKKVLIGNDELSYDQLVIATGAKTNFFGSQGLITSAMPMKNILEALDLRSTVIENFEKVLRNTDEKIKEGLMNIVIAGGGPTGVELAGALGEMKKHILPADYPELNFEDMKVKIIQSGDRLLPSFSEKSSARVKRYLENMDVEVILNTRVTDYIGDQVKTNKDVSYTARTLIWTVGVLGNTVEGLKTEDIGKGERILVDEYNRVKNHEDIFAIGDIAGMISEEWPEGHPMLAPVAQQQGKLLAKNILRDQKGKEWKKFNYKHKGAMATIGKNKGVAEIKGMNFGGFPAWFLWMFYHLMLLIGFRNKTITLFNWIRNYFSADKGMRLIISEFDLYEERRKRYKMSQTEQIEEELEIEEKK